MGKTFFFSDVHLGAGNADTEKIKQKKLLSFLDYVAENGERLFILGDLFEFWFEYRTVIPRGYISVFSALERLQERGIDLHYVAGNHDLWVRDFWTEEMSVRVHFKPIEYTISGKRFFLHHGDGVFKKDRTYRLLKRVFRNRTNIFLYSLLHPDVGIPLAKWAANLSRNHQKDEPFEDDDYRELAAKKFSDGFDYAIFGHLHHPLLEDFGNKFYVNLGDWMGHFTYGVFDGEKFQLLKWDSVQID